MRESALRNQRRVDLYCDHEVIANPEVIEPVEVSDDSEVEFGDGYVGDVEASDGNQENEAGDGNQEKEVADEVLCVPNQDALAQVEEVPISQMNNNSAATDGENTEDNAEDTIRKKACPTVAGKVRPSAPSMPAAHPRPNAPFRAPQHKPNASTSQAPVGSSNVTIPPRVSLETMSGASKATTSRFQDFMPTQSRNKNNH
ncbi:hypothetical protein PIB30_030664 [Stylosanthes scabra]|uniref:Uncharacterized protein n=1 Tax=Stylosanthes scabra TaxID=79078 RepID=A0ABU6QCZ1_9FABA|nr:hypothetical protein [Stylosanthes scabra]